MGESGKITITIENAAADLRQAIWRRMWPLLIGPVLVSFLSLFALYIVASHYISENLPETFRLVALAFLVVVPAAHAAIWAAFFVHMSQGIHQRDGENGDTLEFTKDGVFQRGAYIETKRAWELFGRVVEDQKRFALMPKAGDPQRGALLIQKRWFKTDEELCEFRRLSTGLVYGPTRATDVQK